MNILAMTIVISAVVVFLAISADILLGYAKDRRFQKKIETLHKEHQTKWALHAYKPVHRPHGAHRRVGA